MTFAPLGPAPENLSTNHAILDLSAYWTAIRQGNPLPTFTRPNGSGTPSRLHARHLKASKVSHIVSSPLSPEFYEEAHGVDRLIVIDVRRRASSEDQT
jgi:hypothetical protein